MHDTFSIKHWLVLKDPELPSYPSDTHGHMHETLVDKVTLGSVNQTTLGSTYISINLVEQY